MVKSELTVLFIEDDSEIRKNYVDSLKLVFKHVYEAEDGMQAYELYLEKKPNILIIDINLPKMNGLEFLKKVRNNDMNTKAIMLTSHSDKDILLKAATLKLTEYLVKPVSRGELKSALISAVDEILKFNITSNKMLHLKENFSWNYENKELYHYDTIVNLTKKEKDILAIIFINSINKTTTLYGDLLYNLWDEYTEATLKSLKTFVFSLRKKLPKDTIVNEYGTGYKLGCKNNE